MADRGDVGSVRRFLLVAVVFTTSLIWPQSAHADQPCEVVPLPCTFEALPFTFAVVDAETRQPLADVHALAEWQGHGAGGRLDGPLMVLDAVSGHDGVLRFPAWGPIEGPATGIGVGRDPVITLFKAGYKGLVINNGDPPGTKETQRVRRFYQDGRRYALEPFRGTPREWAAELWRVGRPMAAPASDELLRKFREPYLRRVGPL